jgi:AcrR family transcriptional regulator
MSENISKESVDLRIKRSRKHLIEALLRLMQDQPLQKISVRDITDEAMVNRSTFYAHFTDKYDLFSTAMGYRMQCDILAGLGNATGFTYANVHKLIIVSGNLMADISSECQPTSADELIPLVMTEMQNCIFDVVLDWTRSLNIDPVEAKTLAIFMVGTIFGVVALWGKDGYSDETIEQLTDQIMPLLMKGVGSYID